MACSKIFSGDLPELMCEIIQYFRNDFSTLHSCISVNRLWCRLAIEILWEDPFSKDFLKNYNFIGIYISKLDEDDKVKSNEYGIIRDLLPSSTLFNYPSFIQRLDIHKICHSIKKWVENVRTLTIKEQSDNLPTKVSNFNHLELSSFILLSLIKIFIKNEAKLHTFEIEASYAILGIISSDCFISAFQLILQNPNFTCNVKNLNIHFNGLSGNLLSVLKSFYSNCNSISSLYIRYSHDNAEKELSKVINSQHNLKKIFFDYVNNNPLKSLRNSNCLNTLKSIIFHKIWLKNLEANFKEVFEQLNVLDSIHILYCYALNSTIIEQIINLDKPFKLRSLFMDDSSILQIDQLKSLLQKSGNYLDNIGFELSISNELKLQLFKLVRIYCNNIKLVILLGFDDQNIFPALDLIKNTQNYLNYLTINFCQFGYNQLSYDNKLSSIILQNLGKILSNRLEYLNLALKINIDDLELFFKNSQNIFIRKLLIRNKLYQESDTILPCIKKYAMKEKRISYLAMENLSIYSNDERNDLFNFKDEVKEFGSYGIQVTKYNDLCIKLYDFINELY
ncbi:hypothetical protein RclHR1_04740008 [Rhizophagus clarus]|uniref:F-box domain-containing protein n=1 Tax=Rhizophagus clarus TaxID=94130 RepID=A0A2Z6RWC6_9GLOM|nr:hypothetical protein RclHR1_04740008 [Rhizophagus clarus]GES79298.1 hypothetical protein GLOIN_2v1784893 [Rhizophagus clarus]